MDRLVRPHLYTAPAQSADTKIPESNVTSDYSQLPTSSFMSEEAQAKKAIDTNIPMVQNTIERNTTEQNARKEHFAKMANDEEYRDNYLRKLGYKDSDDYRKKTADRLESVLNVIKSNIPDSRFVDYAVYEHSMPVRPMEETIATRQAKKVQEAINTLRSNNFWRGLAEGFDLNDIASLGFAQVGDNVMALNALNKARKGEELTQTEQSLVDAWKLGQQVEGEISMLGGRSLGANIGYGFGQSMPFVAEMIATGGVASAATKGISKAIAKRGIQEAAKEFVKAGSQKKIKEATSKQIVKGLEKAGLHLAESVVGGAARMPLVGGVYNNYTGKRLEQFALEDDKIKKYATTAWKDAMKAGFETWTEYFTEDIGKWMDAPLGKVGNSLAHSPFGKKIHLDRIADYKGNKFLTSLRDAAKINGLPAEMAEEVMNDVLLNTFYNDKEGWREMASSDYWWQLAGVSALMQGAFVLPNMVSSGQRDYNNRVKELERIKKESLEAIKDPELKAKVAKAGAASSIVERSGILSTIDWKRKKFTKQDAFNAVKYINAQTEFDIAEGESAETERLSRFFNTAQFLGDNEYQGVDGKEDTGDIVQISDDKGNAYCVISGDIDSNNPDTILKARDIKGEVWDVPMYSVVKVDRNSISEGIAQAYAMMFNQQVNQEQLNALQTRISEAVAAGVSTNDVKDILRNNKIEVFEKGDVVRLNDGRLARVDGLNGDHYVVVTADESGTPNVESIGINDMPQTKALGNVAQEEATPEETAPEQPTETTPQSAPVNQAVEAVVVEAERAIDQRIDASANVADGNVYNCVIKEDDFDEDGNEILSAVAIINGQIEFTENGEYDKVKNMNKTVVVRYPDGRQREIGTNRIVEVEVASLSQAKENAHAELREVVAQAVEPTMQEEVVLEAAPEGEAVAEEVAVTPEPTESVEIPTPETTTPVEVDTAAAPEAPELPRTKDGNVDYESIVDPELYATSLEEELGTPDAALEAVETSIDGYAAEVTQLRDKAKKEKKISDRVALSKKADAIETYLGTLNEVKNILSKEVRVINGLAEALGLTVEYVDEVDGGRANAQILGDKVQIARYGRDLDKTIKFLIGHEFTHRLQDLSPEAYAQFKAAVIEHLDWRFEDEVKKLREIYNRQGRYPATETLEDEVVADFAGQLATTTEVFDAFVESHPVSKWQQMWEKVLEVLQNIASYFTAEDGHQATLNNTIVKLSALLESASAKVSEENAEETDNQGKGKDEVRHSVKSGLSITEEMQNIIDPAKANGTYLKAPNGADTNLTPRQWAQVRTKAFKEWFGDWEKTTRIEKLRNSESVTISGDEIVASDDMKAYRKNALEYGKTLRGEYVNVDTGNTIIINKESLTEVLHHDGSNVAHIQSIAAIPQMVESGIYIDSGPISENASKKLRNAKLAHYYVCGLNIADAPYTVKFVVAEFESGDRYYDHSLTEIEKGELLNRAEVSSTVAESKSPESDIKDKRLLSILQTNSSKVVDENGEPKVVYHGTPNIFTAFDKTKRGSSTDRGIWGSGFYFSASSEYADTYAKRNGAEGETMSLFLDLKNPLFVSLKNGGNEGAMYFNTLQQKYFNDDVYEDIYKVEENMARAQEAMTNEIVSAGYDGIIIEYSHPTIADEYVAFEPNQIKSATDNVGTFDANNPDIRYSVKSAPVFYSNAENAVRNIKQEKATPEQWLKMIEKNGGLKVGEDKWLGLSDWLKASDKKTLTKAEVMEYILQNQIQIEEVKYREFGPGLIDEAANILTRELQTIGIDGLREKYPDFDDFFEVDGNEVLWSENMASEGEYEDYIIEHQITNVNPIDNAINERRLSYTTRGLWNKQEIALVVPTIESWNASDEVHFGDAGNGRAIAWVRFGETTDADGNRVLVIDEVQSKRHQDAREQGYAGVDNLTAEQQPNGIWYIYKDGVFISPVAKWAADTPEKAIRQYERMNRVPAAPFEKNWAELAMKRMLRYAAENGFDKVAWTTGEQQAERYNLGAVMTGLKAYKTYSGEYYVMPYNNGAIGEFTKEYSEKELADTFGKELAADIIANAENATEDNPYEIEGEELRFGGSGMKTFYDTMLVNFMNKYGKKWGVKVGEVTMPELEQNNTMHSVDVTDAMRESVMQGQPLFSIKDVPSLVGIHNLSLEKLRKVIRMGGSLANPSVAVLDIDKSDHSDYGDYSLILPKYLVDARLGKNAGTWAGDAWTPTYPTVAKKIKKTSDISRFYKDINKMPSQISSKVSLDFNSYLEGRSANALYYWYLFEKGEAPELREIPSKFPAEIRDALERITNGSFSMFGLTPEQRAECVDVYVAYKYDGDRAKYEENLQHILEVSQKLVDSKNGLVARKAQQDLESIKEYGFDYDRIARFIRDVEYDVRHSGQVDTDATIRAAQEQVQQNGLEGDFAKWKESLDSRYGIEEFIFDGYTPSGSQKWLPHTTENASKWMKKQGRVAATGTFPSFGMFIATVIPRMTSLESIRKRKKQLGNSQEVYDAFKEKWEDTYYNLGKKLQPDAHTFEDYGWWRLMEAAAKPDPQKYIKEQYNIDFSDEDMATLNTLLDAIKKEYPAKYFETKFERPVALSEFAAAVVPDTIPVPVEEYLRSANLNVYKYDKSVEGSKREATLKAVDSPNVRFSLKNTPAAAVMDQKRAEYKNLAEEYNDLLQNKDKNPNFDEALNEWRDRKIDVVRDYLSAFAEDLGIQELSVLDIFNSRGDRDVYGTIVDLWSPEQLTEEEREEAIDELMDPKLAGFHIEQSNGVFIDISHSDNFSLNSYEAVYIHEFTHIENEKLSRGTLEELYEENKDWIHNKGNKTLKDYIEREMPGWKLAEELIAQSMHRLQQRGALEAYVNGAITPEEAMSVLKHTTPLMRDILIYKLNQHKEYVDRANKETGDNGGVYYDGLSHLEREGGKNENPAVLDGGRSSVEEDEEFVEVDIQDLIDRGEDFEIILPDNARFSIKKVEPSVRTLPTAEQMESELKKAGVAPEEIAKRIKEETGWYRNDKGHWSYKISKNPSWNDNVAPIDQLIEEIEYTPKPKTALQLAREQVTRLYNELRNTRANIGDIASKISKEMRGSISPDLVEAMGKRDFDNLIRIIEEAVNKGDLETALRQLGEQLTSLEQAALRKAYNKMMALKLEGTNPRGVSVSRWVDETAREAINTFKDCLEKGKSAAVLEAEFREEWQFGENKKARNPWAMWSAMDLLQRHAEWMSLDEDIEQIDAEIQEIRIENSALFREGRAASANGDKTEAIACYRQIKKNKEEIADLLAERLQKAEARNNAMVYMNRNLDETITMGRSVFAEQKAQREMRRAEIVKMGIVDCIDLKNPTSSQDTERTRMQDFGLALKNLLIAPAYSMNTMLKVISINAPQGEGRLYDHFVRGERGYMAAMANFNAGYNEAMKIYADKAKEIFGKDYEKVLSESDKDSNIKVPIIDGKRVEEVMLPYGTAMYVYMVNKMVDGRVKLSKMGIPEEVVDDIVKAMPYEYIQMADWIQEEYLPMLREKYNETHLECFGVPMAKVDNYVPLKILQSKIYKEVDGSGMDTTTLPTAIVGSIVKRTRNTLPIDLHVNAFEVIREHVENMEHWNAYTFVIQDMNALLSSTEFRRMIEHQNPGLFQRLKEAAQIAAGTYRDEPTAVDKGFGALNKLAASSKIAFRVNTAIKQILSYPAFASYAMSADFFASLMRNLSPDVWKSNFDWAIENVPGFKARWESRSAGNEKLSQATMAEFDKIIKKVNNIGMWPNAFVDALTCANGAKAVYDYRVDFYKERGYEEAEAQRLAKIDAAEAMNATQQSSEGLFISSLQAKRDLFSVAISTFQNSNFAYLRKQVEAIYEFKRDYETEVEYLIKKYTDSGMSEEEAAELAVKDVRKAKVKAAADLAVFTFGLNVLWWFGNNVWKYAFGDDDDREEIEDEVWKAFALSIPRNTTIGSIVESIAGGFGANPSVFFSDLAQTVNEIQYIAENDPKSWNKSAAYITARILVTNGIGVDLTTFANIYQGVAGMIRDGYDVEDLMNILNAPQSQARLLAGKPKDGETLDEYMARMAFVHKRLKSKVDKKDLSRWERDYIAGQQRKLLVENDYSSTDYAEYTKQANAIRQEMGVTRSGKLNEDARFEFKHSDATEKAFTKEVMRYTRKINALQKQLDKMVVFNDAYLQKMLQIQNLRKELIEKYEQHND